MALSIQDFCTKYGISTVLPHRREMTYRRYLKDNNHSDAYCQWLAAEGYKTKNSDARKAAYAFHCLLQPSKVTTARKAGKTARIPIKGWKKGWFIAKTGKNAGEVHYRAPLNSSVRCIPVDKSLQSPRTQRVKEIVELQDLIQLHKEMGHNASMSDKFFNGYFSATITSPRTTRSGRLYS